MIGQARITLPDPWLPLDSHLNARALAGLTALTSGTIVITNNDAHYVPFVPLCDVTVYALRIGGTSTAGNYDLGLYDAALNLLVSKGSTAMANAMLELTIANMRLKAGELYYAAASFSNNTATIVRANYAVTGLQRGLGFGMQATAHPLPNPAVPASPAAYAVAPFFALGVR